MSNLLQTPTYKGYRSELIANEMLLDSTIINGGLHVARQGKYDLEWKGLMVDVKSSYKPATHSTGKSKRWIFRLGNGDKNDSYRRPDYYFLMGLLEDEIFTFLVPASICPNESITIPCKFNRSKYQQYFYKTRSIVGV